MSNSFQKDLNIEHEIAKYLDKNLYIEPHFSKGYRPNDLDSQHKGIDIILSSSEFNLVNAKVDEKCTSHYINKDITTFAFELLYVKDGHLKTGWFIDNKKETEYYALFWPFAKPETKSGRFETLSEEDITGVRYLIVSRKKILKYLENQGFSLERLQNDVRDIIRTNQNGRIEINDNVHFYYFRSPKYPESPVNIVIDRVILWYLADKKGGIIGNPSKENIRPDW